MIMFEYQHRNASLALVVLFFAISNKGYSNIVEEKQDSIETKSDDVAEKKKTPQEEQLEMLNNKLDKLNEELKDLAAMKVDIDQRKEIEKQKFDDEIEAFKEKSSDEINDDINKINEDIAEEKKKLDSLQDDKNNTVHQINIIQKNIRDLERKKDDLGDKRENARELKKLSLALEKEKSLRDLELESLDCGINTERLQGAIEETKNKISQLSNGDGSSVGVKEDTKDKKKNPKIEELQKAKRQVKTRYSLTEALLTTEQKANALKKEIKSLDNKLEKTDIEAREKTSEQLNASIQEAEAHSAKVKENVEKDIKDNTDKIVELDSLLTQETDDEKKKQLSEKKDSLIKENEDLQSKLTRLTEGKELEEKVNELKKHYDEKQKWMVEELKENIDKNWEKLKKLGKALLGIKEKLQYLDTHGYDEYEKMRLKEAMQENPFGQNKKTFSLEDTQSKIKEEFKKRDEEKEKSDSALTESLQKEGFCKKDEGTSSDSHKKEEEGKEWKISDSVSFKKTSVNFSLKPRFNAFDLGAGLKASSVFSFNLNDPFENIGYKKFDVKFSTVFLPDATYISRDESGWNFSKGKFHPLRDQFLIHKAVIVCNPLFYYGHKITVRGGVKNSSWSDEYEDKQSTLFASFKVTGWEDILSFKLGYTTVIRDEKTWCFKYGQHGNTEPIGLYYASKLKLPHFSLRYKGYKKEGNRIIAALTNIGFLDLVRVSSQKYSTKPSGAIEQDSMQSLYDNGSTFADLLGAKVRLKFGMKHILNIVKNVSFNSTYKYTNTGNVKFTRKHSLRFCKVVFDPARIWFAKRMLISKMNVVLFDLSRKTDTDLMKISALGAIFDMFKNGCWKLLSTNVEFKSGLKVGLHLLVAESSPQDSSQKPEEEVTPTITNPIENDMSQSGIQGGTTPKGTSSRKFGFGVSFGFKIDSYLNYKNNKKESRKVSFDE